MRRETGDEIGDHMQRDGQGRKQPPHPASPKASSPASPGAREGTGAPAIHLADLGYAYRPGRWVLRGLNADMARGEVVAVLGPNGRGKTTLLKLLVGLLSPVEGALRLHGATAFVPQLFETAFNYSAVEMVVMGRARRIGLFSQPAPADFERAYAALERLGLDAVADRPFDTLSGGQRQLVIFARALVAEADIVILDEPTSALDLANQALVVGWIRRLAAEDGLTVVFTTHQPQHALWAADKVLILFGGGEHAFGTASDILTEARLTRLYGTPIRRIGFTHEGQWREALMPVFATDDAPPPPDGTTEPRS